MGSSLESDPLLELDSSDELFGVVEVVDDGCSDEVWEEEGLEELVVEEDEGFEVLGVEEVVVLEEPDDELPWELSDSVLSSPDSVSEEFSPELSVTVLEFSSVEGELLLELSSLADL